MNEDYSSSTRTHTAPAKAPPKPCDGSGSQRPCVYTVKKGDNLSTIAQHFGISLKKLEDANPQVKKNPNLIHPGDKLTIPPK